MARHSERSPTAADRERSYAARASDAFADARRQAVAMGYDLVEKEGDAIVRISPEGNKQIVKKIRPARAVRAGTKFRAP